MGRLADIRQIVRCLKRIDDLRNRCSFGEIVDEVKREHMSYAPTWPGGIKYVVENLRLVKLFHRGIRKHPCLFLSMLVLAEETKNGSQVDVNVGLYARELSSTTGHCWVSRDNTELHPLSSSSSRPHDWEELARKDGIVYWWSKSMESPIVSPLIKNARLKKIRGRKCQT